MLSDKDKELSHLRTVNAEQNKRVRDMVQEAYRQSAVISALECALRNALNEMTSTIWHPCKERPMYILEKALVHLEPVLEMCVWTRHYKEYGDTRGRGFFTSCGNFIGGDAAFEKCNCCGKRIKVAKNLKDCKT